MYECIFPKVTIYSDSRYQDKKRVLSTEVCFAMAAKVIQLFTYRALQFVFHRIRESMKHVSQERHVNISDFPQFLPGEGKFRTDIHPTCMDERARVFMDKQMFCLMWDFKFDHSREMDKKY